MHRSFLVLLFAASALAQPTITRLDAFIPNTAGPGGPAITAGSPFAANGFTLQITGTGFNQGFAVDWIDNNNAANNTTFEPQAATATSLRVNVSPPDLYSSATSITIRVHPFANPGIGNTASSPFTVNPRLSQFDGTFVLPTGSVSAPYSEFLFTGGTPPYTIVLEDGSTPPGMPTYQPGVNQNNNLYAGTPTATGSFEFALDVNDPWGSTTFPDYQLQIISVLTITSPPLSGGSVGAAYTFNLTAANGVPPYFWTAQGLPPGLLLNSSTGAVTGTPTAAGNFSVVVRVEDAEEATASAQYNVTIGLALRISSAPLPNGTVGFAYGENLTAANGSAPYTWTATGLPPGVTLNATTGLVNGAPAAAGNFTVTVTVRDTTGTTASALYNVVIAPAAILPADLIIATSSPLPNGTVAIPYVYPFGASGGAGGYTWSALGSAPPGLSISSSGFISGTPTASGQFSFTIQVTDSSGQTASKGFSLTIAPAPLVITTVAPLPSSPLGSPLNIKFAAMGGVPPYTFGVTGSLPPGTSLASDGMLSGTPAATGTFVFRVVVTDSFRGAAGPGTAFKDFTIAITAPALTISTTSPLSSGQVGAAYSVQFGATGGAPAYAWSATGVPAGLSFSSGGLLSGTPTANGQFSLSVTVTDAAGAKVTGTFALTVSPARLVITTASLPNGIVGVAYTAILTASGGVPPYTWSASGLPDGVSSSANGGIGGTPGTVGKFTVAATVKDSAGATASQSFTVTITPPALVITTAAIPAAVVGNAYAGTFLASGGVPPYAWSATGLPTGLSLSAGGALSGTPAAAGTSALTVTVKDSAGTTTSQTYQLGIGLPAPPSLTFNGLADSSNPGGQPRLQVVFGNGFPVDVTVVLTLAFQPVSGPDDPAVQFSTGGRTARITVAAGSTTGQNDAGVQLGTVAGTITITAQLLATGQDITPSPAPSRTIRINATAPVITSITATRSATGFTVVIIGYASSRELTQASLQFTATAGTNLQTSSLTVPIDAIFASWYASGSSAPYGSQFTLTMPFTVQGSPQSVQSVTAMLTSKVGTSASATANLQ